MAIAFGVYGVLAVVFFCALVHEMFHLIACLILKEKIDAIHIYPYGINLKTDNIKNQFHKMIISAAGPFASMIFMIICRDRIFFVSNLALFVINLLPALPLDGGEFLKAYLNCRVGFINSHKIMIVFSKIIGITLSFSGIFLLIMTKFNFSMLIIGVFLLYNQIDEKNNYIHLQKSIFTNEYTPDKKVYKLYRVGVDTTAYLTDAARYIGYGYEVEVQIVKDGEYVAKATQSQILDAILRYGANAKADRLICRDGT